MSRTAPNLETKLAATLFALGLIPYDDAKAMGRTNFLSLFHFDHNDRHAEGGSDEFWNLEPMLIPAHRAKTAKVDAPAFAKNKRVQIDGAIHDAAMASKAGDYVRAATILATAPKPPRPKRAIPSRPFPKGQRPMQNRGFR